MRKMYWPWWMMLFWVAAWGLCVLIATVAQAQCVATPAAAAASAASASSLPTAGRGGFRVASMRWDPVLRQRWVRVESCDHPEWPALEMPVPTVEKPQRFVERDLVSLEKKAAPLVVRAGDAVQLWSTAGNLRMDVAAVAEESGALGAKVRVRLMQRQTRGGQSEREFEAVVRGPRDVEMLP